LSRRIGSRPGGLCLALSLALAQGLDHLSATRAVDVAAASALQQFLDRPATAHSYSASRLLEASGSGQRGWLEVQTDFSPASGLVYQVTAEGGSGYVRSRVLRSLLDEEKRLIERGASASVALSADNYDFAPEGLNDEGLAVVATRPLRKDRSLIAGRMFLTADGDIVRIEGRLAKNPSFWVSLVTVVRSYRRINDVVMPVSLESSAQLRLLGSSTLLMTYRYAQVDGVVVDDEAADLQVRASAAYEQWRRHSRQSNRSVMALLHC
jgi:hypothetical protein